MRLDRLRPGTVRPRPCGRLPTPAPPPASADQPLAPAAPLSVPTTETRSPGVRRITLDADGVPLSALLALPRYGTARATVVALHGAGMRAAYFDGRACPGQSLLGLATELGHAVLAVDRPGYGASAARLPYGQSVAEQAVTLGAALRDFAARYGTSEGLFLLAHSFGGKVALALAADAPAELLGVDVSGCGNAYAADLHEGHAARAGTGRGTGARCGCTRPARSAAGAAVVAPSRSGSCGTRPAGPRPGPHWPTASGYRSVSPSESTSPGGATTHPP